MGRIFFLILAVIMIAIGAVLTITLVFAFIGIPLLIIGIILLLISIFSLVFGTFGDLLDLLKKPFIRKPYIKKEKKKEKEKVIEVEEEGGVYRAKT